MNRFQRQTVKSRLIKLAKLKSTGTPAILACSLGTSERSIKRYIKEIRDEGIDIKYCASRQSYVTSEDYE